MILSFMYTLIALIYLFIYILLTYLAIPSCKLNLNFLSEFVWETAGGFKSEGGLKSQIMGHSVELKECH